MRTTVNFYDFREAFIRMDRGDQFSRQGLTALFEYLNQYEKDCDQQIELDVIALCCDYSEYTIDELVSEYSYLIDGEEFDDDDDRNERLIDVLDANTTVIQVDYETYIIQNF